MEYHLVAVQVVAVCERDAPAAVHRGDADGLGLDALEPRAGRLVERLLQEEVEVVAEGGARHERGGAHGLAVLCEPLAEVAGVFGQAAHVGGDHVQEVVGNVVL